MNKTKYRILSIITYIASAIALLLYITAEFDPTLHISEDRLLLLFLCFVLLYIASKLMIKTTGKNASERIMKAAFSFMFALYIVLIANLTLLDPLYGRNPSFIFKWEYPELKYYLKTHLNLVPFKTIRLFYNGWISGTVSAKWAAVNLLGNIAAFSPFAFFMPLLIKKQKKFFTFLLTMIVIVSLIEILQLVINAGYCDVDDLILNVSGAVFLYAVFHIKPVRKKIRKFTGLNY